MVIFHRRRGDEPLPPHPYRDSALVYAGMSGAIVVIATLTGASVVRALGAAAIFWIVSTAWSWLGYRRRIRAREAAKAAAGRAPAVGSTDGNGRGGGP